MSWAQHCQPANVAKQPSTAPLQQQQPPQQVDVGGSSIHSISAHFSSQPIWPQNYNQQLMQPVQQSTPNNWTPNSIGNAYQQQNIVSSPQQQPVQHNNWPQQELHPPIITGQTALPTSGYFLNQDNFIQPSQQHQYPSMQQSYPPPQQYQQNVQQSVEVPFSASITPVSYSRQSTQQMDNVQETPANNNNDGWGDWDWNDNGAQQQHQQHQQQQQQKQQHQQQEQQHQSPSALSIADTLQNNSNAIEDSFRTEANDNWQWGSIEENVQHQNNLGLDDLHQNSQQPPPQELIENLVPPPPANFIATTASATPSQQKATTMQSALPGIQYQAVHSSPVVVKPTNLPLNDVSQSLEGTQNNNNIPSPVYVSQAKPVSKPPRQYASLPGVTNDLVNAIGPTTPPHAFQNRPETQPSTVGAPPPLSTTLPLPMKSAGHSAAVGSNPFKRAGLAQHHRAGIVPTPLNSQQPNVVMPPVQFFASPPPPPEDFANPSVENHEVIAPDNSEVLHENQEIAPNNDRNEYLQTSHLSEIGGHTDATFNIEMQEQNNESDDFPPPGLSRLVLGQPENESRQVPGTGVENSLNIERQADGEDTDPSTQRSTFPPSADGQSNVSPNQIDITADRNLYLVPGESDVHELRVVTGLENGSSVVTLVPPIQVEQRELELDGENVEDQQQPPQPLQTSQHLHSHHHHHRPVSPVQTSRDEPLEGANSLDRQVQGSQHNNHETESSMTVETNLKDLSNISTGNDESDQRDHHYSKSRRGGDDNKKRRPGNESKEKRYVSEESDFSSDRERRRYREGSVRSERDRDRDSKERKRHEKRERDAGGDRDRDRYRGDDRENRYRDKYYRDREGKQERGVRYGSGRYDADSKYETESSARHERRRGGDRTERSDRVDRDAYEDYRRYRKYTTREERDIHERRGGGRVDIERRRSDKDYREDRNVRRHKDQRETARSEYEEYRKNSSRNARDSDIEKESRLRDKDPRYATHNIYNGYPGYGYDPYAAYYYEQMVRTNPQAYSDWYKKYFGQTQASESITNDGRESVHSGRSSANNEKDRYSMQHHQYMSHPKDYHRHFMQPASVVANMSASMNSTMIESQQQLQQQQYQGGYSLSGGQSTGNLSHINQLSGADYYSSTTRSFYARSEYSDSRRDNLSLNLIDATSSSIQQDPERLTPYKFTIDHPIISLGPGLMVAVKPKYSPNGITNVVKIFKMGANDATNKLFQSFPGPLVRGLTHKKTIIEFCEDQIRLGPFSTSSRSRQNSINSLSVADQNNKPSFTLMWNLLILLLRQNGMVVGTDIAELLIKNQQQFPYETPTNSVATSSNRRESVQSDEQRKSKENTPSDAEPEINDLVTDDRDEFDDTASKISSLTEEEITEKFRNYLLYGNVNEALDWATDNNLWGHALFLASKLDRRSHANVMMKFANKLCLNDPLQTLYQLMSGRTPSSVTSVQDEKWGDWRPHLAMILSNTSHKPELDRKAITTLGDSLLNRGDLFAAHFCYLMAQVGFSKYPDEKTDTIMTQNSVRLVLLGSSHQIAFEEFATNESIMMTEVYEYACSLNDDKFSLVEFQPYKFLLATRMLDYGYQLKCLMYMEQISLHIKRDPTKYESMFINQVYELADRLKYYDPVLEKSMDELQMDGSPSHSNGVPFEEQKWLQELRSLAAEYATVMPSQEFNQDYQQTSNVIDQQFSEINRQFNELNLQYNSSGSSLQAQQQHQSQTEATEVEYHSQPDSVSQVLPANEQQYPQFYTSKDVHQPQVVGADGTSYGNGYNMQQQEAYQQPQNTFDTQQQTMHDQQQTQGYLSYGHQEQQQQSSYEYWGNPAQIQNDEPEDKSNSKSTSLSDNSESVSSTIKCMPKTINGPIKLPQINSSTYISTQSKTDIMLSPKRIIEPTKQQNQKQQLKSFNFTPIERNLKAKQDYTVNNKVDSPTSPITGTKQQQQQQPYLTTTDVSNKIIPRSNNLAAPNNTTNQCKSKTLSLITRNLTDQQLVTKLDANNRNSFTSSAVAKITYVPSGTEIVTSSKRVNFDLSRLEEKNRNPLLDPSCSSNVSNSYHSKATNQTLIKRKSEVSSKYKSIVFNGTYPIDLPLNSRFDAILEDYDPEAHKDKFYDDYDEDDEDDEDDYDDDDEEFDPDEDEEYDENKHTAWTMQELYNDPSIPLNYKRMCSDVESSLTNFEKFLDSKSVVREKETVRPTISMPNSLSQKSGFYEDSRPDESASKAKKTGNHGSSADGTKTDSKNQLKSGQSSNQNSGWFGGIWNKLSLKPKNQMILPDDKNPAIVWDPEKKKWVNTDGDEEGGDSLKPPPKMSDLMPKTQHNLPVPQHQQHQQDPQYEEAPQQMQLQPPQPIPSPGPMQTYSATSTSIAQMPGDIAKLPSLQSNMFKMQRNRTLKNSYVDVFNPSGAAPKPTEQVLAPALPPASVPVGGFFVPGAAPNDGAFQQQHQPVQEGVPQFYNPNQFGGYQQ